MAEVLNHLANNLPRRKFDAVIIGAGGAGMRCSLQLAEAGYSVAVLSRYSRPGRTRSPPRGASVPRWAT